MTRLNLLIVKINFVYLNHNVFLYLSIPSITAIAINNIYFLKFLYSIEIYLPNEKRVI